MKLGTENRREIIVAAVLGVLLIVILIYEFMPSSSTIASTATGTVAPLALQPTATPGPARGAPRRSAAAAPGKKTAEPQNLDPMLHLDQLAASEQIKYEGTGRNIFVAQQADVEIPKVIGRANTDSAGRDAAIYQPPTIAQSPPIPLKFFGFANKPGEPKRIFLVKGEDVFIAGEGEVVDRRYKVVRISPTSVDIQDVVQSGPPQSIPLTQG